MTRSTTQAVGRVNPKMKVAVIGTGYVGLVTGAVLAEVGHDVVCVDRDQSKLDKIDNGVSPIYEAGLNEVLSDVVSTGRLVTTTSIEESLKGCEVLFIAVGTPSGPDGQPDMSQVKSVAAEIGKHVYGPLIVVNKSTVPIGSADVVKSWIVEAGANADTISMVSNPEFLREGSAVKDTQQPSRIVIGASDEASADKMKELYDSFDCPVLVTDVASAELIKYASNCFLATKISFINAMSHLCELTGANVDSIAEGMGLDDRIGPKFLGAGLGWGGSCFPKDVDALIQISESLGADPGLLREVKGINQAQTSRFIDRLRDELGGFEGKKVGLFGLAFKPNTDDIRDAKSIQIFKAVTREGGSVLAHDPAAGDYAKADHPELPQTDIPLEVARDADAVVLVTEWKQYNDIDFSEMADLMKGDVVFDGRRHWDKAAVEAAGLRYFTIGGGTGD